MDGVEQQADGQSSADSNPNPQASANGVDRKAEPKRTGPSPDADAAEFDTHSANSKQQECEEDRAGQAGSEAAVSVSVTSDDSSRQAATDTLATEERLDTRSAGDERDQDAAAEGEARSNVGTDEDSSRQESFTEVPEADGTSTEFHNDQVRAGHLFQIGQLFLEEVGTKEPYLLEVSAAALLRVEALYVPCRGMTPQIAAELETRRLVTINAPSNAGKLMTALHLAAQWQRTALPDARVLLLRRSGSDTSTLGQFLGSRHRRGSAIYVIENAFSTGLVHQEEVSPHLEEALLAARSGAILCTSSQNVLAVQCPLVDGVVDNLRAVLDSHLKAFELSESGPVILPPVADLARDAWPEIERYFRAPFQIERFCVRLGGLPAEASRESILDEAADVARAGLQPVRSWFESLEPNAKLFALLLGLLEGMDRSQFEAVYLHAARHLLKDGVQALRDPREIGLVDLQEAVQAAEHEMEPTDLSGESTSPQHGRALFFRDRAFGDEVRHQIANHIHLLGSLMAVLIEFVEDHSEPWHWRLRKNLAEAIGRLGAARFDEFGEHLERLVRSRKTGIKVQAGTVLGQAFAWNPRLFERVFNKFEGWVGSGDPELMFIAGASLWRFFQSISDQPDELEGPTVDSIRVKVVELLGRLVEEAGHFGAEALDLAAHAAQQMTRTRAGAVRAEAAILAKWQRQNVNSVEYAMRMLIRVEPQYGVQIVIDWLGRPSTDHRHRVAKRAAETLFDELRRRREVPTLAALEELMKLVRPLLSAKETDQQGVEAVIRALADWSGEPRLTTAIVQQSLDFLKQVSFEASQRFRFGLVQYWIESESEAARRAGRLLLTCSSALEGMPYEPAGQRQGLILLDTSVLAQAQGGPEMARRFQALFGASVECRVAHVGRQGVLPIKFNDEVHSVVQRPLLLIPTVEGLASLEFAFILVLVWAKPIDLDDALQEPWADRLLVVIADQQSDDEPSAEAFEVAPNSEVDGWEETRVHHVSHRLGVLEVASIELFLMIQRFRQLASCDPRLWEPDLARTLDVALGDIEAVRSSLLHRVMGGDSAPGGASQESLEVQPEGDADAETFANQIREFLWGVLWLANTDFDSCVDLLHACVDAAESPEARRCGEAGIRLLLRLYTCAEPLPDPTTHGRLLELVGGLSIDSWLGVQLVLGAVRRWVEDPRWERFLARTGQTQDSSFFAWFRQVIPDHGPRLPEVLECWPEPMILLTAVERPPVIDHFIERLQLELALFGPANLVEAPPGLRFGLLIFSDGLGSDERRNRVLDLASAVIDESRSMLPDLVWLGYRLGRLRPIQLGHGLRKEDIWPSDRERRPDLLLPLLERHGRADVGIALIFSLHPILDREDLSSVDSAPEIFSYPLIDPPPQGHEFMQLPDFTPRQQPAAESEVPTEEARQLVAHIVRHSRYSAGGEE